MTRLQFNIAMSTCALSLILALFVVIFAQMNRSLERTAQEQQVLINRGGVTQQIGRNLLVDMGQVALKNPKMKELLARNGYTVNQNQPADGGNR